MEVLFIYLCLILIISIVSADYGIPRESSRGFEVLDGQRYSKVPSTHYPENSINVVFDDPARDATYDKHIISIHEDMIAAYCVDKDDNSIFKKWATWGELYANIDVRKFLFHPSYYEDWGGMSCFHLPLHTTYASWILSKWKRFDDSDPMWALARPSLDSAAREFYLITFESGKINIETYGDWCGLTTYTLVQGSFGWFEDPEELPCFHHGTEKVLVMNAPWDTALEKHNTDFTCEFLFYKQKHDSIDHLICPQFSYEAITTIQTCDSMNCILQHSIYDENNTTQPLYLTYPHTGESIKVNPPMEIIDSTVSYTLEYEGLFSPSNWYNMILFQTSPTEFIDSNCTETVYSSTALATIPESIDEYYENNNEMLGCSNSSTPNTWCIYNGTDTSIGCCAQWCSGTVQEFMDSSACFQSPFYQHIGSTFHGKSFNLTTNLTAAGLFLFGQKLGEVHDPSDPESPLLVSSYLEIELVNHNVLLTLKVVTTADNMVKPQIFVDKQSARKLNPSVEYGPNLWLDNEKIYQPKLCRENEYDNFKRYWGRYGDDSESYRVVSTTSNMKVLDRDTMNTVSFEEGSGVVQFPTQIKGMISPQSEGIRVLLDPNRNNSLCFRSERIPWKTYDKWDDCELYQVPFDQRDFDSDKTTCFSISSENVTFEVLGPSKIKMTHQRTNASAFNWSFQTNVTLLQLIDHVAQPSANWTLVVAERLNATVAVFKLCNTIQNFRPAPIPDYEFNGTWFGNEYQGSVPANACSNFTVSVTSLIQFNMNVSNVHLSMRFNSSAFAQKYLWKAKSYQFEQNITLLHGLFKVPDCLDSIVNGRANNLSIISAPCNCSHGYNSSTCNTAYTCFGKSLHDDFWCSNHGTCLSYNQCYCNSSYHGNNCQDTYCFGISSTNSSVCSGHGTCADLNYCDCDFGFSDSICSDRNFSCFGHVKTSPSVCTSHGTCIDDDICYCDADFVGSKCNNPICFGFNATDISSVCSSHGTCVDVDICSCDTNYVGTYCNIPVCFGFNATDPRACTVYGQCISNQTCSCDSDTSTPCSTGCCCKTALPLTNNTVILDTPLACVNEDCSTMSVSSQSFFSFGPIQFWRVSCLPSFQTNYTEVFDSSKVNVTVSVPLSFLSSSPSCVVELASSSCELTHPSFPLVFKVQPAFLIPFLPTFQLLSFCQSSEAPNSSVVSPLGLEGSHIQAFESFHQVSLSSSISFAFNTSDALIHLNSTSFPSHFELLSFDISPVELGFLDVDFSLSIPSSHLNLSSSDIIDRLYESRIYATSKPFHLNFTLSVLSLSQCANSSSSSSPFSSITIFFSFSLNDTFPSIQKYVIHREPNYLVGQSVTTTIFFSTIVAAGIFNLFVLLPCSSIFQPLSSIMPILRK